MLAACLLATPFLLLATPVHAAYIIIDTAVNGNRYGNSSAADGSLSDLPASGNTLTITDHGSVSGVVFGGSYYTEVDSGDAQANGNTVTIDGGTVGQRDSDLVYGGFASSYSKSTTADNTVTISGGTVNGRIVGGYVASGAYSSAATGNKVDISGGAVNGNVYGGLVQNFVGMGLASDNTVSISGGTFTAANGCVYGGYDGWHGDATSNTVNISGSPDLHTMTLYGGSVYASGDYFTGNTLNLKTSNLTVAGLYNFEQLNFYLPTTLATDGTMLNVTGTTQLSENADGSGRQATVNVGVNGAISPLQVGDKIILINAGTLIGAPTKGEGMQGVTLLYDFAISTTDSQLLATVTAAPSGTVPGKVNPQAKALSEGFVSGPALVNQTADFVADKGTAQAVEAAGGGKPGAGQAAAGGTGLGGFGAVTGGWSRYDTGSHADVSSLSLMAGLAWGNDLAPGRLTLGAFFEYGNGWYDTYNSFNNAPDAHGKGNIYHLGGGILGRMDFTDAGPGIFYTEASVRAGGVHNDYKNGNFGVGGLTVSADYESDAAYYGAHAGVGYVLNLTGKTSLDLYGKYFWTQQRGDSVRLSTGDPVSFDNVDSHRLRAGGRFIYAVNDLISPYAGLAYEQEFDGKAKATTNGYTMDAPSLQGGTGIGELGLAIKASKSMPLSVDLGVQGYVGTREGVTGSLQVKYEF